MWILECEGDVLEHKRIWLRPGKKYLFGRTKPERGRYAGFHIKDASISRKHITLAVAAVKPGQGTHSDLKSELTLTDENTKVGTVIDGERVKGETRTLSNEKHTFTLGRNDSQFIIKWQPVVLTFTFPSKETKGGKDPLIPIRSRLEDLDIKTVLSYAVGKTTHVVAGKRNTAKCLQALINGIYIVDNSFLDALVYTTTPGNLDEPESLSPLEEDYEKNWPDPARYLPAPSKEPDQPDKELFAPNAQRKDIFEGLTFIFSDTRQFDTLQPPITNGGGKALFLEVQSGETTADEFVGHIQRIAKESHGGDDSKVIAVRFGGERGHEEWAMNLQQEVSNSLGRKMIEQNEFLGAILMNDVARLRGKSARSEHDSSSRTPRSSSQHDQVHADDPAADADSAPAAPPARRGRTRGTVKSTFTGFDDGFDPSQVVGIKRSASASSQHRKSQNVTAQAQDVDMEEAEEEAADERHTTRSTRKRPAGDDLLGDDQLPAAAAMKRRRLQEAKEHSAAPSAAKEKDKPKDVPVKAKKKKEIDIQEELREQREREDARSREDEESLHQTLQGMSVDEMKKLAVIESMEVAERPANGNHGNGDDDRWDPRWNGRKNFKKFRRQGEGGTVRRGQTVIVPLEEVKKRHGGVSGSYLLESTSTNRKRKEGRRERTETQEQEEEENRSQSHISANHHEEEVPAELTAGGEHEVIDVDAPRHTRLQDKTGQTEQRPNKRAAPAAGGRVVSKKQKTLKLRDEESDDSDDEMKFRFRRKR